MIGYLNGEDGTSLSQCCILQGKCCSLCHINNLLLTKACSVKMGECWPHSLVVCLRALTAPWPIIMQKIDQYLTILTPCLVNKLAICTPKQALDSSLAT